MTGFKCTLCDDIIEGKGFNLREHTTSILKQSLLDFFESAIQEFFLSSNYNVCKNCVNLLNELEEIQVRSKKIKEKLYNYYVSNKTSSKLATKLERLGDTSVTPVIDVGDDNKTCKKNKEVPKKTELKILSKKQDTSHKISINIDEVVENIKRKCKKSKENINKTQDLDTVSPTMKCLIVQPVDVKKNNEKCEKSECLEFDCLDDPLVDLENKNETCEKNEQMWENSWESKDSSSEIEESIDEHIEKIANLEKSKRKSNAEMLTEKSTDYYKSEECDIDEFIMNFMEKKGKIKEKTVRKKIINKEPRSASPKEYNCKRCSKSFKYKSDLKVHMVTHSSEKPYICEVCGQSYKSQSALNSHFAIHNGVRPYVCMHCDKSFTQKAGLKRHLPIHTGEMNHQCDLCGKRFVHHTSLKAHTLTHTGEKSFECDICGMHLVSGSHLKRHRRVHTGEKNYCCKVCGKRFAEKYNMHSHEKLHNIDPLTEKRNYRCQVCPSVFHKKSTLREHESVEHNITPPPKKQGLKEEIPRIETCGDDYIADDPHLTINYFKNMIYKKENFLKP